MKHLDSNDRIPSATFDFPRPAQNDAVHFDEADFEAIFESSAEALLMVDVFGAIQRVNGRGRELLRLKEPIPRHTRLRDLLPGLSSIQSKKFLAQRPAATKLTGLDATLPNGLPIRITLRSLVPGPRHLLLSLQEATVGQPIETKWRQADADIRSVLDSVQAGVVLFDSTGRVRLASERFGQLFGFDDTKLSGIRSVEHLKNLLAGRFCNSHSFSVHWNSFLQGVGEPAHDELEMARPSGRVIERFSRPVLDSQGRSDGWLELYTETTEVRQSPSKTLQTEKMAALGQFVSGIAHELNNPLTSIMGYAQLLLGRGLSPLQFSEASKVFQEAERARRIVKNLLYFARADRPERTRVDLNEIIE